MTPTTTQTPDKKTANLKVQDQTASGAHTKLAEALQRAFKSSLPSNSSVGRVLGVSDAAVSQWVTGRKRPSPEHMRMILLLLSEQPDTDAALPHDIVRALVEEESDLLNAMNRALTQPPVERLNSAHPSKVQIVSAALDSLERATRSADGAFSYWREMSMRDPTAGVRRSEAYRRSLQILALSTESDLRSLVGRLGGTWDLTVLAPQLLLAAPDADSCSNVVAAVTGGMLQCEGDECSRAGADVHAPELYLFVHFARAVVDRGYDERFAAGILDRLAGGRELCVYHSGLVLEALLRLCRDPESRHLGCDLLSEFSLALGGSTVDPTIGNMGSIEELALVELIASKIGYPELGFFVESLRSILHRPGSDDIPDLLERLAAEVAAGWVAVDSRTSMLGAAGIRATIDEILNLAPDTTPTGSTAESLVSVVATILNHPRPSVGRLLPAMAVLDVAVKRRPDLAGHLIQRIQEDDSEDAVRMLAAARWSDPSYRTSSRWFRQLDWLALSGECTDSDLVRCWSLGRDLFGGGRIEI